MVFHCDSKSLQVSRTLLSMLADINNAVVWMVSTHSRISKSSSPSTNPLVTVPRMPITIGIPVTFMLHSPFSSLARSLYISFFTFLQFYPVVSWNGEVHYLTGSLFLLTVTQSGHLLGIRWSICISKFQRILCVSFSWTDSGLCIYHLFIWSNLNFLHKSLWIIFPTQLCLILYSLYTNLLHSLIMWLIISSLSLHNLHLIFCCILSILVSRIVLLLLLLWLLLLLELLKQHLK